MLIASGELVSLALSESLRNVREGISEVELDQFGNKALFEETTKRYPNTRLEYFAMSTNGSGESSLGSGLVEHEGLESSYLWYTYLLTILFGSVSGF